MGNSTRTLQNILDFVSTIGDLSPVFATGGYSARPALDIGNDVLTDMLSQKFNWKFNRIQVPPFYTISWQQDYASAVSTIGWLEHCCIVDINNTALPKPIFWPECVRDFERSSVTGGRPEKVCWLPNDQLVQGVWPGANQTYTNPLGAIVNPTNPTTNILDSHGNILVLTTYGITGALAPDAGVAPVVGATVNDGTCVWTVVDPKAQGFRIGPMPSQSGVPYQVNVVAQARPTRFTTLAQTLDPIPDDYSKFFEDGFITYSHRHSVNPNVRNRFDNMLVRWHQSLADARGTADREKEDAAFIPDRTILGGTLGTQAISAGWPYGPRY